MCRFPGSSRSCHAEPAAKIQQGLSDGSQASLEGAPSGDSQILQRRETLELIRAYYRITDPKQRRKVYDLVKSMAGGRIESLADVRIQLIRR